MLAIHSMHICFLPDCEQPPANDVFSKVCICPGTRQASNKAYLSSPHDVESPLRLVKLPFELSLLLPHHWHSVLVLTLSALRTLLEPSLLIVAFSGIPVR